MSSNLWLLVWGGCGRDYLSGFGHGGSIPKSPALVPDPFSRSTIHVHNSINPYLTDELWDMGHHDQRTTVIVESFG